MSPSHSPFSGLLLQHLLAAELPAGGVDIASQSAPDGSCETAPLEDGGSEMIATVLRLFGR